MNSATTPQQESVLALWAAILEHEFPSNLLPSGDVSLEALRDQELGAVYDDERGDW